MIKIRIDGASNQLWQWDVNRRLLIEGIPVDTEIHFSRYAEDPNTLITKVYEKDGELYANIPNIMLQNHGKIYIYPYLAENDSAFTIIKFQATVIQRPRPSDYVYTETEIYHYGLLEDRVRKLEEAGGGGIANEIDPTVPDWAKQPEKPKYTASEVGALPNTTVIPIVPTKVSAFDNDVGYMRDVEVSKVVAEALENFSGGVSFETDATLSLKDGILSVNTTNNMEQDNTLPITSAGVFATVGNIEALLKTI